MSESVYKVIELVGTSAESWEKAAAAAVERAAKTLRDLRIAEIVQLDMQIEDGKVRARWAATATATSWSSASAIPSWATMAWAGGWRSVSGSGWPPPGALMWTLTASPWAA